MKSQCFAQFGRRSAACTLMFPQQSLETKRCENIRERDSGPIGHTTPHPSHTLANNAQSLYIRRFLKHASSRSDGSKAMLKFQAMTRPTDSQI